MALGVLFGSILKSLVLKEAKKQAKKTGVSTELIDVFSEQISKGEVEADIELKKEKPSKEELKTEIEEAPPREGRPELEVTDRTFEEQLSFRPPEETLLQTPAIPQNIRQFATPQPDVLQPSSRIGRAQTLMGPIQGRLPLEVPRGEPFQETRPSVPPGIFAGIKEGALNIPTTAGEIPEERVGRRTAFAAGKTLGDFLRSQALGLSVTQPGEVSPSRQISQKRLTLLEQLDSGERTIATLRPFERIILRPPATSTIDILEGELERDRELGLEKPDSVTDEEWFSANDETKRALMGT